MMVAFEPMRVAPVTGGYNDSINFGNVSTDNEYGENGDVDRGGAAPGGRESDGTVGGIT